MALTKSFHFSPNEPNIQPRVNVNFDDVVNHINNLDNGTTTFNTPKGLWKNSGTQVHNGASSTSYTDLDVSAVVGANAALVLFKVTGNLDNVAFRQNGDTTDYFSTSGFASTNRGHAVTGTGCQILCATDSAGVVEWRVQTTNTATIVVVGYIR